MPLSYHLFTLIAQWRLDALALGVAAAGACIAGRRYLRQNGVDSCPSRAACLTLLAVVLAGALLAEWTARPFHVAIALQVLAGAEELAIALLIPRHEGEMPTVWHAWRLRRAARARLTPPPGSPNP